MYSFSLFYTSSLPQYSKWILVISILWFTMEILPISSIDCFKCVSYDGSAPWCEDTFHHNFSTSILETDCQAGRKGRSGLYPATFCVKIRGTFKDTGESMVIRDCSLDSGSLTTDTELVRTSHCGALIFQNRYVIGCVQSCQENACNSVSSLLQNQNILSILLFTNCIPIIVQSLLEIISIF